MLMNWTNSKIGFMFPSQWPFKQQRCFLGHPALAEKFIWKSALQLDFCDSKQGYLLQDSWQRQCLSMGPNAFVESCSAAVSFHYDDFSFYLSANLIVKC